MTAALWHLRDHPLTAILITVLAFLAGETAQRRLRGAAWANPVVFAIIAVNLYLLAVGQSYAEYLRGASAIQLMLGPATVALALPLYRHRAVLARAGLRAVLPACAVMLSCGAFAAAMLALGGGREMALSTLTRAVTTPVALALAEQMGTSPSLAVFFVFVTGISGVLFGVPLLRLCRIGSEPAVGLALGLTCHALGVMRALQVGSQCAAFAVLGMGLMAVVAALLVPWLAMIL